MKNTLYLAISLTLTSCGPLPQKSNNNGSTPLFGGTTPTPEPVIDILVKRKIKRLDTRLKGPADQIPEMQITARYLKTEFANDDDILRKSERAYKNAQLALDVLKARVKGDIDDGLDGSSDKTITAAKKYYYAVDELRSIYSKANGANKGITTTLMAIASIWNYGTAINEDYNRAVKLRLNAHVDKKLKYTPWSEIK